MDEEKPEADFLYCDVDRYFHRDPWPGLAGLQCDVAVHYFKGVELLSGVVYVPAGPRRRELMERWAEMNEKYPHRMDQRNLQTLLAQDKSFRVVRLPPEYCCIFDLQRRLTPDIDPICEQFQASRRYKATANRR